VLIGWALSTRRVNKVKALPWTDLLPLGEWTSLPRRIGGFFRPVLNRSKSKRTNEFRSADLMEPAEGSFFHSMTLLSAAAEMLLRIESLVWAWLVG
jgi:hypothetical protein